MTENLPHAPPNDEMDLGPGNPMALLLPSIIINGVLPFLLYQTLTAHGVKVVPALVAGSIFPLTYTLWTWRRTQHLDVIAGISLAFIVVSAAASLISGSARFTLLKESFFTGLFGVVFFASLLNARPLMFFIARQFVTGNEPEAVNQWNDRWDRWPGFRHTIRVMTVIWGFMFLADALIRTGLVFILSTSVFLVASQVLFYGAFALTFYVTLEYGRRARSKATAELGEE